MFYHALLRWVRAILSRISRHGLFRPWFAVVLVAAIVAGLRLDAETGDDGNLGYFAETAEQIADFMVSNDLFDMSAAADLKPIVFVDMDDSSYDRWGQPTIFPRDKLALILAFIADARPSVAIVDVDLTDDAVTMPELLDVLQNWPRGPGDAHLIIARSLSVDGDAHKDLAYPHPTPLEPIVAGHPHLHWGHVYRVVDEAFVLREANLWQLICSGDRLQILPAVELIAHRLTAGVPQQRIDLETFDRPCTAAGEAAVLQSVGQADFSWPPERHPRVLYSLSFRTLQRGLAPHIAFNDRMVPLLTRIRAHLLADPALALSPTILEGRIVVVSGSNRAARDMHLTPKGWMPGAMILINSLQTLMIYGDDQTEPDSKLVYWSFLITNVILIILIFQYLRSIFSALAAIGLTFSGMLLMRNMAPFDVIIQDYVTIFGAIALVKTIEFALITLPVDIRRSGWRFIFYPRLMQRRYDDQADRTDYYPDET